MRGRVRGRSIQAGSPQNNKLRQITCSQSSCPRYLERVNVLETGHGTHPASRQRAGRALLLVASLLAAGCGPSIGGYCALAADCEGGNDADEEACNIRFEELEELGNLKNCSQEFEDWFTCVEEDSRCNDDRYVTDDDACGPEKDQFKRCADIGGL